MIINVILDYHNYSNDRLSLSLLLFTFVVVVVVLAYLNTQNDAKTQITNKTL
jgi:succinate dehydrogenase hydrophobic anchor subunit